MNSNPIMVNPVRVDRLECVSIESGKIFLLFLQSRATVFKFVESGGLPSNPMVPLFNFSHRNGINDE